ncbi:putative fatty acyl-CoA reductase CG5065 [Diabrotica virgifera virgifera]|uniref:Fatty acyl-CoA reductase n=1 Tax=Diabrotica virgifera virgifera TaxID=50390 RepID=A0ABM5JXI1_DIAVI|nr:putative fatty acyl-CoA reductase CG5065 [Diabrotica virgifera virgifera]XP_050502642.1 putative fatty acyl-CoA reductase CG5065 [Diabrotica virgifera virgifera]XP_050502643.1 putative fatty acyl-CoA reductase CG5065 [Diabrotica virgifera virgifera]XP_050502644.1 putative fatty acyl-CoA reductase CG5065 [Diabrotica virgifera virgifera]
MLNEARMSALQNSVNNSSSVSEFYNGKTLFITGCTGFMGKVLLEKLLRSCPGVSKIYLLIRPKKGQHAQERLQQLLCSPLFDTIRKERPLDLHKVLPIEGDITQPELNISVNDRAVLERSVNIVFHSAATVKFDEKLKLSVTINMLGTQRLIELCKRMDHLEALVHVSTAYCNCDRSEVKETIYPPPIGPDQVVTLVEALDEDLVDSFTSKLIGKRPNTYTFTKALAECWLQKNKGDLPIVIIRPSIVLSSINEPLSGWVDNWNGPTGIIAAAGKGLIRTMLCDPNKVADFVPVDMVINLMIVSAWRIGTTPNKDITIYNCVTGMRKPIKWKEFVDCCFKYSRKHPVLDVSFYPQGSLTSYRLVNSVRQLIWHWIPAYIIDSFVWLSGGKPILMRVQEKLEKAASCLQYFTTNEWKFDDENVRQLAMVLSESDREEFCFDVARINWEHYLENYVLGIRRFIFKEDVATLPKARKNMSKLFWTYKIFQVVSVMCMWHFLTLRYAPLRRLWSNALRLLIHLARMLPFI